MDGNGVREEDSKVFGLVCEFGISRLVERLKEKRQRQRERERECETKQRMYHLTFFF